MARTGVILINVGTPDAPHSREVRRYLREFLSDPRVVDINPLGRWLLLNLIILPVRPKQSAAAYKKIWTPQGSPLLVYSEALRAALQQALGEEFHLELGMRYGEPSLQRAVERLRQAGITRVVAVPLFPQYASASTGTAAARLMEILAAQWNVPELVILGDFYDHPGFLDAVATMVGEAHRTTEPDYVLFSYHGLPERQVVKSEEPGFACSREAPCPPVQAGNRMCYRAQCYATSRALAQRLGLSEQAYGTSFQSRLGRTPWIKPYTDLLLPQLRERGVERLMVATPSFVADCLETEEEIGIRLREQWLGLGGKELHRVACVNDHPVWVGALAEMIRRAVVRGGLPILAAGGA